MNEIIKTNSQTLAAAPAVFNVDYFSRWTAYIDATPKTIATYTRAIKQFFKYLAENDITEPDRDTVIAYRDHPKQDHKPTTVQSYLAAVNISEHSGKGKRGKAGHRSQERLSHYKASFKASESHRHFFS